MVKRPAFFISQNKVVQDLFSFEWFPGFSISQKQKSLAADEIKEISSYNYFTDIEFNPEKSINTQVRTAAIIRLLLDEYGELPDFSKEDFIQYHKEHIV